MASATIDVPQPDALFVIHRQIGHDCLAEICRRSAYRHVLCLSTHLPFQNERDALSARLAPAEATFITFAGLLSDAELAEIDDLTAKELQARNITPDAYIEAYQALMTSRKNAAVHRHISNTFDLSKARIHAADGLGVSSSYWASQGSERLQKPMLLDGLKGTRVWRLIGRWRHLPPLPKTALEVEDPSGTHLFVGTMRRLALKPGTRTNEITLNRSSAGRARYIATTLHEYRHALHRLGQPVRIFTDGYLPTNYPYSYLGAYGDAEFVASDPFSARWLRSHGCRMAATPGFVQCDGLPTTGSSTPVSTVVVLLNHAGDWSALIQRSDTDILADACLRMAKDHPSLNFVLRPHPGMELPAHEGSGAMARLASMVQNAGHANLAFSTGPLADDLKRGDLFISEYSATLIEAWRLGKHGVIANLTGRRSLMQDYSDLGFASVSSPDELSEFIKGVSTFPMEFTRAQHIAGLRYNQLLAEYLRQ